ncbi:MAG: putative anti-sigma regulatory factor, serine/threonine protein kinase [Ilumatobacteraceae bacterium]|nr:putative anti-sigma regulatory factor, serine/threonine protein kinase [Ilumatobacteraceae bacterium]
MRSGAASDHLGYYHETSIYGSDDDFLALVVPFLCDGVAAGEPTIVALGIHNTRLLRNELTDLDGITFIPGEAQYMSPAATIRNYRERFAYYVAAGAEQIRVVGDVPHPGLGSPWASWARYEAAVSSAYDEFPLWGLCPYDARITPDHVLEDVLLAHSHVCVNGQHAGNRLFLPTGDHLRGRAIEVDVEHAPPDIVVAAPTPAIARQVVRAVAEPTALDEDTIAGLELAVSEVTANAWIHGTPPVTLRAWVASPMRVVIAVHDAGEGVADPLAGLMPHTEGRDGHGLWLAHQVCADVVHRRGDGFTVFMTAGDPRV